MDYKVLAPGNNVPEEVYAIVEIPRGEGRIKYEYRLNGMMIVDRLRGPDQPFYPVHYCGIPATQSVDGDPLDLLILGDDKLKTGDVMAVRPVAVFWMTDEKGSDPKIIAVPADHVSEEYRHIRKLEDIAPVVRKTIEGFFSDYKAGDLAGKFSTTGGWDDVDVAHATILDCVDRWNKVCAEPASAATAPKAAAKALSPK